MILFCKDTTFSLFTNFFFSLQGIVSVLFDRKRGIKQNATSPSLHGRTFRSHVSQKCDFIFFCIFANLYYI